MSERYLKLFTLSESLYAVGSPVIIVAGALLKDSQTSNVLAQIKFKNIGDKVIKALTVVITCFDTVGGQISEPKKHQYLDLSVGRDTDFAQKTPIFLKDNTTRSFSVIITEIIFDDNTKWNDTNEEWNPLEKSELLENKFDNELVKQYRLKYGEKCKFIPKSEKDLWVCSCGAINNKKEFQCHYCNSSFEELINCDMKALEEEKQIRLENEQKLKVKSFLGISIIILLILVVHFITVNCYH